MNFINFLNTKKVKFPYKEQMCMRFAKQYSRESK